MINASGYDASMYYISGTDVDMDGAPELEFQLFNGIKPVDVYDIYGNLCMNTGIIDGVTIDVILLKPGVGSRGSVGLDGVEMDYLQNVDDGDLELLLKGYREIEAVFFGKEPFDGVTTNGHFWPCSDITDQQAKDDNVIQKWIMNNIQIIIGWVRIKWDLWLMVNLS